MGVAEFQTGSRLQTIEGEAKRTVLVVGQSQKASPHGHLAGLPQCVKSGRNAPRWIGRLGDGQGRGNAQLRKALGDGLVRRQIYRNRVARDAQGSCCTQRLLVCA